MQREAEATFEAVVDLLDAEDGAYLTKRAEELEVRAHERCVAPHYTRGRRNSSRGVSEAVARRLSA